MTFADIHNALSGHKFPKGLKCLQLIRLSFQSLISILEDAVSWAGPCIDDEPELVPEASWSFLHAAEQVH